MKQKMKRALWMLVCLMAIINVGAETVVTVDGLEYSLSGAYASVKAIASGNLSKEIVVPATITHEGLTYTVNTIAKFAFNGLYSANRNVEEIVLPNSIRTIGTYAFSNKNGSETYTSRIHKVSIGEGVLTVGSYAFANESISTVEMAKGPGAIGAYAFAYSGITNIKIPEGVGTIDSYAFAYSKVDNVKLPEGLWYIGDFAFQDTKITSLTIPSTVEYMGDYIFKGCDLLRTLIYLPSQAPRIDSFTDSRTNWTATSNTYVPSRKAYSRATYSINNATITEMISFSENTFDYTGKSPSVTWTSKMDGYTANITTPILPSEAGTHQVDIPVTFTRGEEVLNVNIPYNYTIKSVTLKAKVNNVSRLYGEENPDFGIIYTGFVNDETMSVLTTQPVVTTTATRHSNVGEYSITISGGESNNYKFEYENATLTVKKAPLTINVEEATKKYGEGNPAFSLKYSGLKNDEEMPEWETTPTFTTKANQTSEVGVYDVNVTCAPLNYDATIVQGKLSITKAPLTIKAVNATRQYCGKGTEFTYTYSGFVNDDKEDVLTTKPTIQTEATSTSNVGVYTITPAGAQAKNYDISYESGTLSITQVPLTVSAISCSRVYGEENPAFSFAYQGFVNNETKDVLLSEPTASTSANINSNAGTYDIRVSGGRAFNYALNYENGELTIIPRNLKISVGDYERPYNEENPTFTFIYEGLGSKDTGASLQSQPVVRTTATKTSDIGTYPLEVSGAYSPNYTITYSAGTLTVVKAEQTFEWDQDLSNLNVNEQVELQAKASSGLPISYTMETIDGAELYPAGSKTYLECKAPCEFVIKAVQEGNSNYYSTQRIIKNVKISKADDGQEYFITIRMGDGGFLMQPVELEQTYTYTVCADEHGEPKQQRLFHCGH